MTAEETLDPQKLMTTTMNVAGLFRSAYVSMMVLLGLRLGLYRTLSDAGPVTSEELARRTELHERWLREWLRGQAAAGLIEYKGDGRFELSPECAVLLADENDLRYMGNHFDSLPRRIETAQQLPESFRTGIGQTWDGRGSDSAEVTERLFRNWYLQMLVPVALPMLDGALARLVAGAKVADVGCGAGIALIEMAKAFPDSEFHGYELSENAITRAEANRDEAGTDNVSFHNVAGDPLPADERFDLITTFDCLHDMTQPGQVAAAIRAAIRPDGLWFIVDINGAATFEENLTNPLTSMMYAMSVLGCLSSALSEPDGAGLGTLGLPEPAMRELAREAGFTRFRRLDLPHPVNAFYEVRP